MTLTSATRRLFVLILFIVWAVTISACSQKRPTNPLLAFIFPPEKTAVQTKQPVVNQKPVNTTNAKSRAAAPTPHEILYSHKPFIKGKCGECHKGASGFLSPIFGKNWDGIFRKGGGKPGPLVLPAKQLCVKCHKDLSLKWAKKRGLYLHKTAADGDCLKCHDAHQSRHPDELLEAPNRLCVSCHNSNTRTGMPTCVKEHIAQSKSCLSCHNPHLGKTRAMLKKNYKERKHKVAEKSGSPGNDATLRDRKTTRTNHHGR